MKCLLCNNHDLFPRINYPTGCSLKNKDYYNYFNSFEQFCMQINIEGKKYIIINSMTADVCKIENIVNGQFAETIDKKSFIKFNSAEEIKNYVQKIVRLLIFK